MNKAAADMCNVAMDDINQEAVVSVLIEGTRWEKIDHIGYDEDSDTITCRLTDGDYITCAANRLVAVRRTADVVAMPVM